MFFVLVSMCSKMKIKRNIIPAGLESDEEYDEFGDYIEKTEYNIKQSEENFQLTLQNACAKNDVPEIIRALNSGSVDINCYLFNGWTGLMHAAFNGSLDAITYLLQNGADPLLEYDCHNVIMCVCNCNYVSNENDLIECLKLVSNFDQININSKDRSGLTALMYACTMGYLKIVEFLIEHGADIEITDNQNGETALFFAVRYNHVDVVKLLLSSGADGNATDKRCQTVHRIAENKNMVDILILLNIDQNAQLEVYYSKGNTYWDEVMVQMENGFSKDVQMFLENLSLEIYTKQFISNNITFKQLLSGTKDQFFDMGIHLLPHRKLLDTALKTFHTWRWSNHSLGVKKCEMNADHIAKYLATIVRQLHILDSSIIYLGIHGHTLDLLKGQESMNMLMNIKATEEKIFKILEKQVKIKSVDYIGPYKLKNENMKISFKDKVLTITKYGIATSVVLLLLHIIKRV